MSAGGGEPQAELNCLSRSIRLFNPQSHVTGPKTVMWLCGVFGMSLKDARFKCGKVGATYLFERMLHTAPAGETASVLCSERQGAPLEVPLSHFYSRCYYDMISSEKHSMMNGGSEFNHNTI